MPQLSKVFYFRYGCAGQYKNLKKFSNLCYHKKASGLDAEWNFFASPTVKAHAMVLVGQSRDWLREQVFSDYLIIKS
jgi:hypothetical protein